MNSNERVEESEELDDDITDIPNCIESLVSSAEQLSSLAKYTGDFYIKILLLYGSTSAVNDQVSGRRILAGEIMREYEPVLQIHSKFISNMSKPETKNLNSLIKDQQVLKFMQLTLEALPLLNELSLFIERCLMTVEATLKRTTYYLNSIRSISTNTLASDSRSGDSFCLTAEVRIYAIFVAIMDLIYALVSLEKTFLCHTNIRDSLELFKRICLAIVRTSFDNDIIDTSIEDNSINKLPVERLKDLIEYIGNIQSNLCRSQNSTVFQQFLEHFQHLDLILSKSKTAKGFKNLGENFSDFILFYAKNITEPEYKIDSQPNSIFKSSPDVNLYLFNSNIIPTVYMNSNSRRVFALTAFYLLYNQIFKKSDKKLLKIISQILTQPSKLSNIVPLVGSNCYIRLDEFFLNYYPSLEKGFESLKKQSDQILKFDLSIELERQTMRVYPWLLATKAKSLSNTNTSHNDTIDSIRTKILHYDYGYQMASEINEFVKTTTFTYMNYNNLMSKQNLVAMLRLVALMKSIDHELESNRAHASICLSKIENFFRNRWRRLFSSIQKRLISTKYSERRLDTGSILTLTEICIRNIEDINTFRGRNIISIALTMMISSLNQDETHLLNRLLSSLSLDLDMKSRIDNNCGYLYWSIPIFGVYYANAFEADSSALGEISYFLKAVDDIAGIFEPTCDRPFWSRVNVDAIVEKRVNLLAKVADDLIEQFKLEFLDKICQELEMELRAQTQKESKVETNNPFRRHLYNFKTIFKAKNSPTIFKIFDQTISLQNYAEHHINRVCYNLTAIAPNDWSTYDTMINLARHKYHLQLVNNQLPTQTVDFGMDLLDIIRNLPLFISRYSYDLTNELFIEKSTNRLSSSSSVSAFSGAGRSMLSNYGSNNSSNQLLNVLQIRHIAKSIQTHGFGLLNSSVNCTYQTMKRLINLFSKQMMDEKLRVALFKELQHLKMDSLKQQKRAINGFNNKTLFEPRISFDKANRMAKKFKLTASGLTGADNIQTESLDLDSLRQTVTQLGNLLAFVRSIKSGALSCASKLVDYIPDLDNLSHLRLTRYVDSEFGGSCGLDSLRKATENFDRCLSDFDEHFQPKTNYFSIIVDLFTKILSDVSDDQSNARDLNGTKPTTAGSIQNGHHNEPKADDSADGKTDEPHQASQQNPNLKRDHLAVFFLIIPALTINYIDYMINCKERVSSRSSAARFGALISDDGFSMGVAFLLTVLRQKDVFSSLDWFGVVQMKLHDDKQAVESRMKDSRYEESLKLTSSVTLKRINRLANEYAALNYTLSSAMLFFRSSTFAVD